MPLLFTIITYRIFSFVTVCPLTATVGIQDRLGDTYLYSCGSTLAGLECEIQQRDHPTVQDLFNRVYVRENLTCDMTIEIPYYSSQNFVSVCAHCGCQWTDSDEGKYPVCDYCKQQGHLPLLKRKRKLVK